MSNIVNKGLLLIISSPSGAGKTTLLNILGTLDDPNPDNETSLIIDGKDVTKMTEKSIAKFRNDNIGFIFQVFNLLPVYTVFENVEFALLLQKKSALERKKAVMKAWV